MSNNKDLKKLGQAIKAARLNEKISQEELAAKVNVDRTYISLLERGMRNPSVLTVITISRALNTNLFRFLD